MEARAYPLASGTVPALSAAPGPSISYPSWMDAQYMLAACKATEPRTLIFGADALAKIPGNPQRWGLLVWNGSVGIGVSLTPFGNPLAQPLLTLAGANAHQRITLFEWGPLVAYEWTCSGAQGAQFQYSELCTY